MNLQGIPRTGLYLLGTLLVSLLVVSPAWSQVDLDGYLETGYHLRFSDDGPIDDRSLLKETRLMLEEQWYGDQGERLQVRTFLTHNSLDGSDVELRSAYIDWPVGDNWEIRAGRQVLSWAPARYEFINDRFAKDYESFFLGRDLEFLKAPNDAVRFSAYSEWGDWDLVWIPEFEPDRSPAGRRIPILHPETGQPVSSDTAGELTPQEPDRDLENGELHLRWRTIWDRWELALYGYRGFTGQPMGTRTTDSGDSVNFYPERTAGGFSMRGPFWKGLAWLEGSYDDIRHPLAGRSINLPPDHFQFMAGYEARPFPTVTNMIQATWTRADDAEQLRNTIEQSPVDAPWAEQDRYTLQVSSTRTYWQERLTMTGRVFWGITDEDWHARLEAEYTWSDAIQLYGGIHGFGNDIVTSRFGVLGEHDLTYLRLRYSF